MQFATIFLALTAAVTSVVANKVTFRTLDDATRTIYFTSSNGYTLDSVTVSNAEDTSVEFPSDYIGNFYAVKEGGNNTGGGMLGEVTFGGWEGLTYFDVSAIVDPTDKDNVKEMWPAGSETPVSGCEVFPCDNAYYQADDVQTKSTDEVHLITTLGSSS